LVDERGQLSDRNRGGRGAGGEGGEDNPGEVGLDRGGGERTEESGERILVIQRQAIGKAAGEGDQLG
jgi:hypothetical protein